MHSLFEVFMISDEEAWIVMFRELSTNNVNVLLYNLTEHCSDKPIEATYPKHQTLSGKLTWIELMIMARMSAIAHY